jgi:hypothetical protein
MPVNKRFEETFHLKGTCTDWFRKCERAFEKGRFGNIRADDESFIIDADYKGLTIHGTIRVLLTQDGQDVEV